MKKYLRSESIVLDIRRIRNLDQHREKESKDHGKFIPTSLHFRSMPEPEAEETFVDSKTLQHDVSFIVSFFVRLDRFCRVLFGLLVSYFLVTAGVIYDIIVEPPSVGQWKPLSLLAIPSLSLLDSGSTTDEYGRHKPVAFMAWRINGQYIMEGLAAAFMFTLGGIGFILLDQTNKPNMPRLNRVLTILCSFIFILVAYCATKIFIR